MRLSNIASTLADTTLISTSCDILQHAAIARIVKYRRFLRLGSTLPRGTVGWQGHYFTMALADIIDNINSAMTAATAAAEASDYAEARKQAEKAYGLMVQLPSESELSEERLQWRPERIREYLDYLQKRVNQTARHGRGGAIIRPAEVTYKRG